MNKYDQLSWQLAFGKDIARIVDTKGQYAIEINRYQVTRTVGNGWAILEGICCLQKLFPTWPLKL